MLAKKSRTQRPRAPTEDLHVPQQHDDGEHHPGRKFRGGGGGERGYAASVVIVAPHKQ